VQEFGGGGFDRGGTVLGGAGRRTMGTHGLTCRGGYQTRHSCEMVADRMEIRNAVRHGYNNRISK
jgi:hypothetical protein